MVTVNVLFDNVSGRVLYAGLEPPSSIPAGMSVIARDMASLTDIFDKRINMNTLQVEDKSKLQLDSSAAIPISTVTTALFSKHDGVTGNLMDDSSDDEVVQISARQPDFSFNAAFRRAFFDVDHAQLDHGVGQVKIAAGQAPGDEILVVFNDTLRPLFQTLTYS